MFSAARGCYLNLGEFNPGEEVLRAESGCADCGNPFRHRVFAGTPWPASHQTDHEGDGP